MADGGVSGSRNEQEKLGHSAKAQQKYGTATKTPCSATIPDLFVKHVVQKDETLPGIALKYGRSVQQLKSVNSLWSDWQLGVREFILIPVSSADEHCSHPSSADVNNGRIQTAGVSTSCELVTRQELVAKNKLPKSSSAGHIANDTMPKVSSAAQQTNNISVQDYFSKYDTSLESIKKNVQRMEQTMNSRLDTQNPLTMLPSRRASSLLRHSRGSGAAWSSDIESLDPLHEPELRFSSDRNGPTSTVGSAHGKTRQSQPYVPSQTASQRLQRTHDELFQL